MRWRRGRGAGPRRGEDLQPRFAAITRELLADIESARPNATHAVVAATRRKEAAAGAHMLGADAKQLAIDALDKIANAATVQLRKRAPQLAAVLASAIHPHHASSPTAPADGAGDDANTAAPHATDPTAG